MCSPWTNCLQIRLYYQIINHNHIVNIHCETKYNKLENLKCKMSSNSIGKHGLTSPHTRFPQDFEQILEIGALQCFLISNESLYHDLTSIYLFYFIFGKETIFTGNKLQ